MENWTNEQVLNFIGLMWEQNAQAAKEEETELDPLNFLPDVNGEGKKITAPVDASTVVEVAKQAFVSLGDNGEDAFSRKHNYRDSFESPVTEDAVMIESVDIIPDQNSHQSTDCEVNDDENDENAMTEELNEVTNISESLVPKGPAKSFVAKPAEPAVQCIPDPARKKNIVDWLYKNIQSLNKLAQLPFDPGTLWRLHQHYFTPVVNESGGDVYESPETSTRIVSSVPEVSRGMSAEASTATPSTQSSDENVVLQSDPVFPPASNSVTLPMLKRKVSYRFLGDAGLAGAMKSPEARATTESLSGAVAKMIEDGASMHSMPPKIKRARRNKTRISFLPRIKEKLDSHLDVCHEKALILMRQLYYVEGALLEGRVNPQMPPDNLSTHLCGILANEAEMILMDMM